MFSIFREAKILNQLRESSSILFIGYGIYIIYHFGQHCYLSNPQFVLKQCNIYTGWDKKTYTNFEEPPNIYPALFHIFKSFWC